MSRRAAGLRPRPDPGPDPPTTPLVIGVEGTSGGCGASTWAAALAVRAQRAGLRPLLVEATAGGAGLDVLLGLDHEPGVRWGDLRAVSGTVAPEGLLARLPGSSGSGVPPVLAASPSSARTPHPQYAEPVLAALARVADPLVLDLPRDGHPDLPWWRSRCTHLLAVVGSGVGPVAAAASWTGRLVRHPTPWVGLCLPDEPRSGWSSALAEAGELPVLARLPRDPAVAAALAAGEPVATRGRLARVADTALRDLPALEPSPESWAPVTAVLPARAIP